MPSGPDTTDTNGMVIPGEDAPFAPVSDWLNRYLTPMRAKITTLLGNIANLTPRVVALEARPRVARGSFNGSTNGSGEFTLPHGLGVVPAAVVVTGGVGGALPGQRIFTVVSYDATNLTVRVYRLDAPGVFASNPVNGSWVAVA